jgi:catechol 2,3-dioxygenase-like lactoylglutathione lyase family enzyme
MERHLNRRSFLLALPAIALTPSLITAARGRATGRRALSTVALNHVELAVSDVGRSVEFYEAVLGTPVQARRGGATILRLGAGPQFMAIRAVGAGEAPSLARMGLAVDGFDVDGVIAQLEDAGLTFVEAPPSEPATLIWTVDRGTGDGARDLYLGDPNGLLVQVVDPSHCGGEGPLGSVCGAVGPAPNGVMRAVDLNHFTSSTSNPAASVAFFQETFGLPIQAYQAATPALGIAAGPQFLMFTGGGDAAAAGPPMGNINHVCMTVEDFDVERILSDLADFGISARLENEGANVPFRSSVSMRMPNRGGAPEGTPEVYFTDPDGLRIQVQDPTYCGGGGVLGSVCDGV